MMPTAESITLLISWLLIDCFLEKLPETIPEAAVPAISFTSMLMSLGTANKEGISANGAGAVAGLAQPTASTRKASWSPIRIPRYGVRFPLINHKILSPRILVNQGKNQGALGRNSDLGLIEQQ